MVGGRSPVPESSEWGSLGRIGRMPDPGGLQALSDEIVSCRKCPRLVAWREEVARQKRAAFAGETYWGRPVPGFGDPAARILILGLAPAAHGGNRTGRIFTGDRSGDFLFAALHRCGRASQPTSVSRDDGLQYLVRELRLLDRGRVIVCLGAFAWDGALRAISADHPVARPRPPFAHAAEAEVGPYTLIGSFHPSQQNTFTGKLTPAMLDAVFERASALAGISDPE